MKNIHKNNEEKNLEIQLKILGNCTSFNGKYCQYSKF